MFRQVYLDLADASIKGVYPRALTLPKYLKTHFALMKDRFSQTSGGMMVGMVEASQLTLLMLEPKGTYKLDAGYGKRSIGVDGPLGVYKGTKEGGHPIWQPILVLRP